MGTNVDYDGKGVYIPADHIPACLAALNELDVRLDNRPMYLGNVIEAHECIQDAIEHNNFQCKMQPCGAVEICYYTGEKSWGEEHFFAAIAPFVTPGGEMIGRDEYGGRFRYLFRDGCLFRQESIDCWDEANEVKVNP